MSVVPLHVVSVLLDGELTSVSAPVSQGVGGAAWLSSPVPGPHSSWSVSLSCSGYQPGGHQTIEATLKFLFVGLNPLSYTPAQIPTPHAPVTLAHLCHPYAFVRVHGKPVLSHVYIAMNVGYSGAWVWFSLVSYT